MACGTDGCAFFVVVIVLFLFIRFGLVWFGLFVCFLINSIVSSRRYFRSFVVCNSRDTTPREV